MENIWSGKLLDLLEIDQVPGCDLFTVARFMLASDAHMARGVLVAAGIPAVVADANHVIPSIEGARVQVPQAFLQQAQETLKALARGEFALGDDADVGKPG